jgi:hypothetical protein
MIRIIFHRAFDRYGNRLKGRFVASLDGRQLCISQKNRSRPLPTS